MTISDKLDTAISQALEYSQIDSEVNATLTEMAVMAASNRRFDNREQFESYLTEGVALNVNRLASQAIGVPQGQYIVYEITPQTAVLIPRSELSVQETNFSSAPKQYEVFTQDLLGCWNKAEKLLAEAEEQEPIGLGTTERKQKTKSIYPRRTKVKTAITNWGGSQEELADLLGVDPSTVSRWTADDDSGVEPGGRNPDLGHAVELAKTVGAGVEDLFGDVESSNRKATSGSGGGRNKRYTQGNSRN